MELTDKVALVTGGSRGIGAATAKKLATHGARVAVTYQENRSSAEATVEAIRRSGGTATALQTSAENRASVDTMMDRVVSAFGRIDILVNNAGIFTAKPLSEVGFDLYTRQFNANVWGMIQITQAALPHFPASGGRIINIASARMYAPRDGTGLYAASKAAVSVLTHALAIELGPRSITVNAVAPAVTETDMTAKMPPEKKASFAKATPLGRIGLPEDIADVIAFLASDEARWVNGRTIRADGGLS
ncbi:glucose 1-dehydrogenase [Bradyrhizobium sp. 147]|uniref:SDR family NAD(P)-dependent oxidoreductase n=1 Tax=Bradyrhizobium sp. 147 TaxID=2782623 RepID=UPI001FFACB74|nr:glucose 1-dehydrogenase [Bradyrhizobium sp. 147]MCK1680971.1 glucose 1-dehydrogenase [Bradyrhizobium sp. 147]